MAGFAKSKGNKTIILKVSDKKEFIKKFNSMVPTEKEWDRIQKAGRLFGEGKKEDK